MMTMTEHISSELDEKYYHMQHESGLNVYVFPKKMTTTYALFATKYGSVDNCFCVDGKEMCVPDGIAHYLEHRMFTQADGSDITELFSEYGADSNAYTTFTRTAYLFAATENIYESLAALLDFVTQPYFTEELVERERGIITQEIKMGEDDPYDRCFYGLMEAMYQNNNVRIDVAGSEESVKCITAQMLQNCYNAFYTPNNMALVLCGNVSTDTVMETVRRILPKTFLRKEVQRIYPQEPRAVAEARKEVYMNVAKPIFNIGIKDMDFAGTGAERSRRDATMSVLCEVLFSRSGEFYNRLFEENLITPEFSFGYSISETFAFVSVSGEADDPDLILAEIKKHIATTKTRGVSAEDFERCRRALYADYVKGFDSTDEISNNMLEFLFDGGDIFTYGDLLRSVTLDDVNELLARSFDEDLFAMSVVYPDREERN